MLKVLLCSLLILAGAPLSGCASQQRVPEEQSNTGARPLRVVLLNQTAAPLRYRYVTVRDRKIEREHGTSSYETSISINLDWHELAPGAKVQLDVMPGSDLSLRYQGSDGEHEQAVRIDKAQQLSLAADGPQSGPIAPGDDQPVIRFGQ